MNTNRPPASHRLKTVACWVMIWRRDFVRPAACAVGSSQMLVGVFDAEGGTRGKSDRLVNPTKRRSVMDHFLARRAGDTDCQKHPA